MKHSKKHLSEKTYRLMSFVLITLAISACSSKHEMPKTTESVVALSQGDERYSFHTHQKINDYTDRLAHELFRNMRTTKLHQPILVTSFVKFDDTLKKTSKLGNMISESLIGNMQEYDVQLMDVHLTGGVDITANGDLVFSRKRDEILYSGEIAYVLSGVIVKADRGFTVNARIMELKSKRIISTASTYIPSFVLETS